MQKPKQSLITVILPYLIAHHARRPVLVRGVAVPSKGRPVAAGRADGGRGARGGRGVPPAQER